MEILSWINCKDKQPEKDGAYLAYGSGSVYKAVFLFGSWHRPSILGETPTHWMPLPNPPQD